MFLMFKLTDGQIEYLSTLPCATLPGEKAFYSNYMYDILGLAIEALSGQSIESVFQEKIFEPLGMSSTSFQGEAGIDDVAMGLTPALEKEKSVASQGGILVGTGPDIGIQSILKNRNGMVKGSYCIISTTEDMVCYPFRTPLKTFYANSSSQNGQNHYLQTHTISRLPNPKLK